MRGDAGKQPAAIAGEWETHAYGVVVSMTTAQHHCHGSSEQMMSLDHGALLRAADSSGELWDQCGPESQQLGAWPVQHTPGVVLRTSQSPPDARVALSRRQSEVNRRSFVLHIAESLSQVVRLVHVADPPADSYQPPHMSPSPESSSPPRAVAL